MSVAYTEFFLTSWLLPGIKSAFNPQLALILAPVAFLGVLIRLLAFYSASSNFHHLVRYEKEEGHELITTGIYAFERHPGYLGFFIFSVTSQFLIKNIFSGFAFIYVLWNFFYDRICDEECCLIWFFKADYILYREKVRTWIPLVEGKVTEELVIRKMIAPPDQRWAARRPRNSD